MALVIADRVRETTSSAGTGTITLTGAFSGFQSFSVIGNGNTTYYAIIDSATGAWEVGVGTYTAAGNTLSRDSVLASSNSGSLVPFAAGLKDVICTQPATRAVYLDSASNVTVPGLTAAGQIVSTQTGSATTGAGQLYLNGATSNRIDFNSNGATTPSFTTRSDGTKITLFPALSGSQVDYAIGISAATQWYSVPVNSNSFFFKWFGGETQIASLDGTGVLTLAGNPILSAGTANGVTYLNGSKVLTSGSALTWNGSTLLVGGNTRFGSGAVIPGFATASDASLANNASLRGTNAVGSSAFELIKLNTSDHVVINNDGADAVITTAGAFSRWNVGGGEQMRLTSTGLGIGTSSPAQKLHVNGSTSNGALSPVFQGTQGGSGAGTGASIRLGFGATTGAWCEVGGSYDGSAGSYLTFATPPNLSTNAIERMRLDSSGNLGLGVTPSASSDGFVGLSIKNAGNTISANGGSYFEFAQNAFWNSGWKYANTAAATRYEQGVGGHYWFTAPSGTAGAAITFTQAMTLDASSFLTVVGGATIQGLTVGRGAGASATNTAVGFSALVGTSSVNNVAVGSGAGQGAGAFYNMVAVGYQAANANTTGGNTTAIGASALLTNTTGAQNVAVGTNALRLNLAGASNTAVGDGSAYYSLGNSNTAIGASAFNGASTLTTGSYNTAVGSQSLYSNTTASNNTAVGYQAGYSNTTGVGITAIGYQAVQNNTTGYQTTAVGYQAAQKTTGANNTAVGYVALRDNTTGQENAAFGKYALVQATTGSYNTALGSDALYSNTTANNNTAVGYQASYSSVTGAGNTAIGNNALRANTASNNTAVGNGALTSNTSGTGNTAVGNGLDGIDVGTLALNTTGSYNVAMGQQALRANTTGANNTGLGTNALGSNTTASNNTAVGYQAAYSNTTGTGITAVGVQSLYNNTTGTSNTAVGAAYPGVYGGALGSNTTGGNNAAFGSGAMFSNTTASNNTAMGHLAMYPNTTGAANVALGSEALRSNTTASNNTAVGYQAGYSNTTGVDNTFIGASAANATTTGLRNVAVGTAALDSNTTGLGHTAIGYLAGQSSTTTDGNTFIGYVAGYLSTGTRNTFIGPRTGAGGGAGGNMTTGSSNTIIGAFEGNQGGLDIRTASNYIVLADGDGNPRGVFDASGNFGVGLTNPGSYGKLAVNGSFGIAGGNLAYFYNSGNTNYSSIACVDTSGMAFATGSTERARIDSSGNLLVGLTSTAVGGDTKMLQVAGWIAPRSTTVPGGGVGGSTLFAKERVYFGDNTGWTWDWYTVNTSGTTFRRFYYTDAGAAYNTSGVWGTISDAKLKENVVDATPKLQGLMQVRVVNYNLIGETQKQIGVIAQELEQVFPGLVDETKDKDAEGNDLGTTTKAVKYSVFVPMLIKAIQEQQALILTLQADVAALKAAA